MHMSPPCKYAVLAAKRLMDKRCTHSEAAVMDWEKRNWIPSSFGKNCGLNLPATFARHM